MADDDRDDRFFFTKSLGEVAVLTSLTTVKDGEQLMEYLHNSAQLPHVLFLDLNMPRKTGIECLVEIMGTARLKKLTVVIYSTSLTEDVADSLYDLGASYYLHKRDFNELPKVLEATLVLIMANASRPSKDEFILNFQEA